jgi:hypothetical protein
MSAAEPMRASCFISSSLGRPLQDSSRHSMSQQGHAHSDELKR